ncbi:MULTISPECIES: hypothetical protein [Listeria]|uniref:hypothetical protein n=1 Tax=Listeria TaxID=1637 RepID=UPI000B58ABCA|nr:MULTISPECIES: hypothetical protein [Listeria]
MHKLVQEFLRDEFDVSDFGNCEKYELIPNAVIFKGTYTASDKLIFPHPDGSEKIVFVIRDSEEIFIMVRKELLWYLQETDEVFCEQLLRRIQFFRFIFVDTHSNEEPSFVDEVEGVVVIEPSCGYSSVALLYNLEREVMLEQATDN